MSFLSLFQELRQSLSRGHVVSFDAINLGYLVHVSTILYYYYENIINNVIIISMIQLLYPGRSLGLIKALADFTLCKLAIVFGLLTLLAVFALFIVFILFLLFPLTLLNCTVDGVTLVFPLRFAFVWLVLFA